MKYEVEIVQIISRVRPVQGKIKAYGKTHEHIRFRKVMTACTRHVKTAWEQINQ